MKQELTPEKIIGIIQRKGEFTVNPQRSPGRQLKLLEDMRKQGLVLVCREYRNQWSYRLPKVVR